ncbi:MAG: DNA repair protein RecN [Candidatus Binatales bacterium]
MLLELRIRDFAIIEEAALQFGPGLNVLSGETGAGKTIIMSALAMLLGARASAELIRVDRKEAAVEARFDLAGDTEFPRDAEQLHRGADQGELLVRRVIAEGGRSRVLINDELATVNSLAKIGDALVQIYGQHEQQSLLRPETHRQILDRYAGLESELAEYGAAYERAAAIRARVDELSRRERERADLIELARFKLAELERAAISPAEDAELAAARAVLANAAKLAAAANEAEELLYGAQDAALDLVARAQTRLGEAAAIDPKLNPQIELIASARVSLEEAAHGLRGYAERIEADPARLEQIENRLAELNRLKRKYGGTIESALETLARSRAEIAELESMEENKGRTEAELANALDALAALAKKLSTRRHSAAAELKRGMETELKTLGMRSPVFDARISAERDAAGFAHRGIALGPGGFDTVEFYLSPNLGQPPMALVKIASGGELSRIMLALKSLEARRRGVATLIFDEVDAGIGGAIAEAVGRKLKLLSRFHQVLCITHLPQIAAFADTHFVVEKEERRGATRSRVNVLKAAERAEEIARMLGGAEITDRMRRAARELLDRAQV